MIAGLLAQACRPIGRLHGCVDARRGRAGGGPRLIAEDLTEVLPAVLRRLYDAFGIDY